MPYPRYLQSLLDFPSTPPLTVNPYKTQKPTSSSSRGLNPSILIIALILTFVFLISVSIHFLLRHIERLRHRRSSPSSPSPSQTQQPLVDRLHVSPDQQTLIDSLPLFSFDSIATVQTSAPDCAVCLSKFEPHDQLRFLPACCHAFHSRCIDTWLASNHTCPLCRSSIHVPDSAKTSLSRGESFRLEMGSISRRRPTDSGTGSRRSYSMGSFDYVIDDDAAPEVSVSVGGGSDYAGSAKDKEEDAAAAAAAAAGPSPPGSEVAEVAGGRGWLKEYVDRLASSASSSFSSTRALSFRLRGGFGVGCSRRSDAAADSGSGDLDGNKIGEEAGNFFRWLTGHDW